jgi:hypothetical protein
VEVVDEAEGSRVELWVREEWQHRRILAYGRSLCMQLYRIPVLGIKIAIIDGLAARAMVLKVQAIPADHI